MTLFNLKNLYPKSCINYQFIKFARILSAFLIIILLVTLFETPANANNNITFITNGEYSSYSYSSIAYGSNRFVAVGFGGAIKTSEDGSTWVKRESGTPHWLRRVIWTGKMFIAVGYGYSPSTTKPQTAIIVSADGIEWQSRQLTSNADSEIRLGGVAYSGKKYVAVGQGAVCYSDDGINWNTNTNIAGHEDVTWGNGKFVAVGYDYTKTGDSKARISYSTDGVKWVSVNTSYNSTLNKVIWAGRKFIAVGKNGLILTSTNGTAWKKVNSGVSFSLRDIAYNGKLYIVSTGYPGIIYSTDALTWKSSNTYTNNSIDTVTWGMNKFVSTGLLNSDSSENFLSSSTGTDWKIVNASNADIIDGIGFDNSRNLYLVYLKDKYGIRKVIESSDGVKWAKYDGNSDDLLSYKSGGVSKIAYNGKVYVKAEGYKNPMRISTDGINWTNLETSSKDGLNSVIWTGKIFVAVGYSGSVITSTNGTEWTKYIVGNGIFRDISFNGNTYIAMGDCGECAISTDSKTWTYKRYNFMSGVSRVIWDGKTFLAAGNHGVLFQSNDGILWNALQTSTGRDLIDIVFAKGKYLIQSNGDFTVGS